MKKIEIAKTLGVTPSFVSQMLNHGKFTTIPALAIAVSKITGKLPIQHINPRLRKTLLLAYPNLKKGCVKKNFKS